MSAKKSTGDYSRQSAPVESMEVSSDEFDELANTERLEATTKLARQYGIRLNLETALIVLLTAISSAGFQPEFQAQVSAGIRMFKRHFLRNLPHYSAA